MEESSLFVEFLSMSWILDQKGLRGLIECFLIDFMLRYRLYDTSKKWICASDKNVEKEALHRVNSVIFQLNMLWIMDKRANKDWLKVAILTCICYFYSVILIEFIQNITDSFSQPFTSLGCIIIINTYFNHLKPKW